MDRDLHRSALKSADKVSVTPHAQKRGYSAQHLEQRAERLEGSIYLDREKGTYHIVDEETVLVLAVRNRKRIVVTAYPRDEGPRYHLDRFELVRG